MIPGTRSLFALVLLASAGMGLALGIAFGRSRTVGPGVTLESARAAAGEVPEQPLPDPAGRAVLPASACATPERLASTGPSPRCVIRFDRAVAAAGLSPGGSQLVVAVTHAATAAWKLPGAPSAMTFEPLQAGALVTGILVDDARAEALLAVSGKLLRYDVRSGRLVDTQPGPGGEIEDLAWSRNGTMVIAAGGRAEVLDREGKARALPADGAVVRVAIDELARRAVAAEESGELHVFDVADPAAPARTLAPALQPAGALVFSGGLLLVAGADGTLRMFDPEGGSELVRSDVGSPLVGLSVSPDGRRIATAARDHVIRLHEPRTFAVERELTWHEANVSFVGWGAGSTLVSVDNDGNLALWDSSDFAP